MTVLAAILDRIFANRKTAADIVALVSTSAKVTKIDTRIQSIKAVAALRISTRPFPDDAYTGLSDRTMNWLLTLDTDMLLKVISATYSQLCDHIAGRRSIRGLLAADVDSVAAYCAALKPKISMLNADEDRRSGGGPKRSIGGMKL